MKKLFTLTLLAIATNALAAADWKVVAESVNCEKKIQILGKDGEKFLKANVDGTEQKLIPSDNSVFQEKSLKTTEYVTDTTNKEIKLGEPTLRFIRPSEVEANPPKVDVNYSGVQHRCKMQ